MVFTLYLGEMRSNRNLQSPDGVAIVFCLGFDAVPPLKTKVEGRYFPSSPFNCTLASGMLKSPLRILSSNSGADLLMDFTTAT